MLVHIYNVRQIAILMSQRSIVFPQWVFCLAGPSVPVTHHYLSDNAPCTGFHIRLFSYLYSIRYIKTNLKIWSYSLIFHNVRKWDTLKLSLWHIFKIPVPQCPTMSHNVATISMKVSGWSPTETKSLVNACPRKWARSSQDIRCPHLPNLPDLPTWELPLRT